MTAPTGAERRAIIAELFTDPKDQLAAYRKLMDWYAARDPHGAVGGMWEEIGKLQIDYLVKHGLQPAHRMMDFGCGTLRAGRHFIGHLDAGHYTGVDISPVALNCARQLVEEEGLAAKHPRFVLNDDLDTVFDGRETYDFILAQSVFTHLHEAQIEDVLAHVGKAMTGESRFFFTFNDAPQFQRVNETTYRLPAAYFRKTAAKHGLAVRVMDDYPHPRKQTMAIARLRAAAD